MNGIRAPFLGFLGSPRQATTGAAATSVDAGQPVGTGPPQSATAIGHIVSTHVWQAAWFGCCGG
jgi:hypothetical protein